MLQFERQAWKSGYSRLAGVDEAGRGPLAGPVVAAAVFIDRALLESQAGGILSGLDDSKKLSESKRLSFYALLDASAHVEIGTGVATPTEIDDMNILRATHIAMDRALSRLSPPPDHVLIDGLPVRGLPCSSTAIVQGDSKSLLIAAASVVAKVTRDRMMRQIDCTYPEYGFAQHKGYSTRTHILALMEHGPSPVHRRSFQPVRDAERINKKELPQLELSMWEKSCEAR